MNNPTEFLYKSGSLSMRFFLQKGMVDDFQGVLEMILMKSRHQTTTQWYNISHSEKKKQARLYAVAAVV